MGGSLCERLFVVWAHGHDNEDLGRSRDEDGQVALVPRVRREVKEPPLYRVLLHNDDYTPMDFVILVLQKFFHKSHKEATEIMLSVHHKGVGHCGVFPFGIAETKVSEVNEFSHQNRYPLKCSYEKV